VDAGRVVAIEFQHEALADQALGKPQHLDVEQGAQLVQVAG
jgi:hypothetical protein